MLRFRSSEHPWKRREKDILAEGEAQGSQLEKEEQGDSLGRDAGVMAERLKGDGRAIGRKSLPMPKKKHGVADLQTGKRWPRINIPSGVCSLKNGGSHQFIQADR